tara:strand:+ start:1149 stop:1379 length:231 start_codon:yes stop_codon:yes gene_type:complete
MTNTKLNLDTLLPKIIIPQNAEQAYSVDCLLDLLYKAWEAECKKGNENSTYAKKLLKLLSQAEENLHSYMECESNQ